MRTTINIDNDIYNIVRSIAEHSGMSLGKTISMLVRSSLHDRLEDHGNHIGPPVFTVAEDAPLFGPDDIARGEDES